MRESDYGLDLLASIEAGQLKVVDFSTFNVTKVLEVIKAELWKKSDRPIAAALRRIWFSISARTSRRISHGALLIVECLADYYRTEKLVVYDYVGENDDLIEHRIKEFVVTGADLKLHLGELQSV